MIPRQIRRERLPTVAYLNAGGRGTRLADLFEPSDDYGVAKALLEVGSPSIRLIDHHINKLRAENVGSIVVAAGDQDTVAEYVQDVYLGESDVTVVTSAEQQGTGGDLVSYARTVNNDSPLFVQNVDTILDIDVARFRDEYFRIRALGGKAVIALTQNEGVPNENAYAVAQDGLVVTSREFADDAASPASKLDTGSSTGAVFIGADFLAGQQWLPSQGQLSLYGECLHRAWQERSLYAYDNGRRFFRDVGTTAAWLASINDPEFQGQLCYSWSRVLNRQMT